MRLLLIEDDQKIALFVKTGLKEAGFAVDHAADGEDGLHLALTEPYDLAVIDLMLPKVDGLTIIKEMRKQRVNTPGAYFKRQTFGGRAGGGLANRRR